MSVQTLRNAAAQMRTDWAGTTQEPFYNAVADWLALYADACALNEYEPEGPVLAVARAYLGEEA